MHAAVLGGITHQPVSERVLWRLDTPIPSKAELLVLTQSEPSWAHLVEQAGWTNSMAGEATVRNYDTFLNQLTEGQEYLLRVRANPTYSKRDASGERGKLHGHRTSAYQLEWFTQRVSGWGFTPTIDSSGSPAEGLIARQRLSFSKGRGEQRNRVTVDTATYQAQVLVTDPAKAKQSLLIGVGRAKAYGCGLITLAPARPRTQG